LRLLAENGTIIKKRIVPKSNIKVAERGKFDIPNTQVHNRSLSWLCAGLSIGLGF